MIPPFTRTWMFTRWVVDEEGRIDIGLDVDNAEFRSHSYLSNQVASCVYEGPRVLASPLAINTSPLSQSNLTSTV